MARTIALLTIALAGFVPHKSESADNIDVMFVFANDVSLSLTERIALEIEYEGHANIALLSSGLLSHTFEFSMPFVNGATSYNSKQKTWLQAIDWMDEQLDGITVLSAERELYESDIILMVVDDWLPVFGKQACGNAGGTNEISPNSFTYSNSNNYAVAAVDRTSTCPDAELIPHELGHVLLAEHQITGNPPLDNSHDIQKPRPYNHGLKVGNQATLMYTPKAAGDSYYNLFSGSSAAFTTSQSDVVKFFRDDSWDEVAAYRPVGPPTSQSCTPQVTVCNGSVVVHLFTPYINEPYEITNVRLETRTSSSQSWIPGYDGPFTCPSHSSGNSFWYRLIIDTIHGSTTCGEHYVYVNPWDPCDDGEEW